MPVRLKDIAKIAQTSEATVSLVLNDRHRQRVSEAMRERIKAIAEELGYQPNRQAQLLASGKTQTVGVLVNSLANTFFSGYIGLLEDQLATHNLHALPAETRSEPDRTANLFAMVDQRFADAVISLIGNPDYFKTSTSQRKIISRLECYTGVQDDLPELPGVAVDYAMPTRDLFSDFRTAGARRPGLLMAHAHDLSTPTPTPRARFFSQVIGDLFDTEPRCATVQESASFGAWYDQTRLLLDHDPTIDALFFHNAHVAAPVLKAIQDVGRRVGQDLAVATFDDPEFAAWMGPGLSVVREPVEQVSEKLVESVVESLSDSQSASSTPVIPAVYESRASSQLS